MPANTAPIFPIVPLVGRAVLVAAQPLRDGTGANVATLSTAGADGGRCDEVWVTPQGTNAKTVVRVWLNNGSDPNVAANNVLIAEIDCPASVASATVPCGQQIRHALGVSVPAGWRVLAATATAGTDGWAVAHFGGSY
jgi:hypothetical protein